jgi:hypothetical protein
MTNIKKVIFYMIAIMSLSGAVLTGCASSGGTSGKGAGGDMENTVRDSGASVPIGTYGSMDTGGAPGARPDLGPGATHNLDSDEN